MKIKSMTATFGKLDRATLTPGPGFTLVHAPNEGGKSTWAAFWRAMLYGIDTRDRDKKGHLADKNRYQPWSGAPMEGELTLELEGRDITIRRGPRGSTPFGSFAAVYTGTQEPVPGLTAANCGELLTGVGPEAFSRSAFLGNGDLSVTTAPELERRIATLVSSGQEDVSFSQAMGRLKEWKNRRQVNRSVGEIPKLEGELAQAQAALDSMEQLCLDISRLEGERARLEEERQELLWEQGAHRRLAQKSLNRRYAQAEEEYQEAQQQLDTLESERAGRPLPDKERLKQAQGELQYLKVLDEEIKRGAAALEKAKTAAETAKRDAHDERFAGLDGAQAAEQVDTQLREAEQSRAKAAAWKRWGWLSWGLMVGILLFFQLYFAAHVGWQPATRWFDYGLPALAVALFLLGGYCLFHSKKVAENSQGVLLRYRVHSQEELTALVQGYQDKCQKLEKAAHEVEVIQNAVTERQTKRDTTKSQLLDFVHQFAPEVKDLFGCSAALSRALSMDHDLALARERTQERRRRLDDLAAQGGQPFETLELIPPPEHAPEETERLLSANQARLEEVKGVLAQTLGRRQALGDPAALSAREEVVKDILARKRLELNALGAAMDALNQANARLQERFSPELNRLAGQYMAQLTGGKYQAVSFTRELDGFVQDGGGVLPRSALYLSRGTADQLYLAVRLAVCQLCLPDKPPIFLDDALAAFDDDRLTLALELLWELSGKQQLILFTCQKREGEVLFTIPGVTQIEL